jgi:TPR repeat protein
LLHDEITAEIKIMLKKFLIINISFISLMEAYASGKGSLQGFEIEEAGTPYKLQAARADQHDILQSEQDYDSKPTGSVTETPTKMDFSAYYDATGILIAKDLYRDLCLFKEDQDKPAKVEQVIMKLQTASAEENEEARRILYTLLLKGIGPSHFGKNEVEAEKVLNSAVAQDKVWALKRRAQIAEEQKDIKLAIDLYRRAVHVSDIDSTHHDELKGQLKRIISKGTSASEFMEIERLPQLLLQQKYLKKARQVKESLQKLITIGTKLRYAEPLMMAYGQITAAIDMGHLDQEGNVEIRRQLLNLAANIGHREAQYHLACEYYKGKIFSKNLESTILWLERSASRGHVRAQFELGDMYYNGEGTPQDHNRSFYWFYKAAIQGRREAQFKMGAFFHDGVGVSVDESRSIAWFQKSAEQDMLEAQCALGRIYQNPQPTHRDIKEAIKWLERAVSQGSAEAHFLLGRIYYLEEGYKDRKKAFQFLKKAADQGYIEAIYELGAWHLAHASGPEDYREADKCFRKAAAKDHTGAQYALGKRILERKNKSLDEIKEALKWLEEAAHHGNLEAQSELASFYLEDGEEFENIESGLWWLKRAAQGGNRGAQGRLGWYYLDGKYVKQAYSQAFHWLMESAKKGSMISQHNVGFCYERGYGVEQSFENALIWYRLAAEQGNAASYYAIGFCYEKGNGVNHDFAEAMRWYEKAAEKGSEDGQVNLGNLLLRISHSPDDVERAKAYFKQAAKKGNMLAFFNLGILAERDSFTMGADPHVALEYFLQAANLGDALSMLKTGFLFMQLKKGRNYESQALFWIQKALKSKDSSMVEYLDTIRKLMASGEMISPLDDCVLEGLVEKLYNPQTGYTSAKADLEAQPEVKQEEVAADHLYEEEPSTLKVEYEIEDQIYAAPTVAEPAKQFEKIQNPKYLRQKLQEMGQIHKKMMEMPKAALSYDHQFLVAQIMREEDVKDRLSYEVLEDLFEDPFFNNQVMIYKTKNGFMVNGFNINSGQFQSANNHRTHPKEARQRKKEYKFVHPAFVADLRKVLELYEFK